MSGYPMAPQPQLRRANATMIGLRDPRARYSHCVVVIATPDWRRSAWAGAS
jgi:hypothetical protein